MLNSRIPACIIGVVLLLVQGCAKYKEFDAVFPPENNSLVKYQKIVIINKDRNKHLYNLMENALKTQLTSIYPGNVKPAKGIEKIDAEIRLFKYNPKVESTSEEKTAYLSFDLKAEEKIFRGKTTSTVLLRNCNYLRKKDPCRMSGRGLIAFGTQTLKVILTGKIYLKDGNGNAIIPVTPVKKMLSDSGKFIKTPANLMFSGVNQVAYDYAKKIIPHKQKISSEIMSGGDSVSVDLIENGAFNLAINRLDNIVTKTDDPDYEDLYNLGLCYEALNELRPALEYYLKAGDQQPDNDVVQTALKRVRRIVQE